MSARAAALAVSASLGAALLAPGAARACAVCAGQDSAAVSWALLKGSALLSLTPLAMVGLGVWILRRRARRLAAARPEGGQGHAPPAPAAGPS
ncbi:MAG: hypothetical protein OZ948_18595 [Deltaproteobacteria bacterium]|nr:hypothetical protein [Deltaproteobacteria bacterium]